MLKTGLADTTPPQATSASSATVQVLPKPEGSLPLRIDLRRAIVVTAIHLLSLTACIPWLFSWSGLLALIVGHHLFGMLGICLGYHRLLTHRSLKTPKWFERVLATLGVCCLQDTPGRWVAIHRMHHQESDKQPDPHTPNAGLFWSHMGWILHQNQDHHSVQQCDRYAHDVLRDPYYRWLERGQNGLTVYILHAMAITVIGFGLGFAWGGNLTSAVQLGSSFLIWGVLLRTVFVWHGTWAVNSFSHCFGYRNYETREESRNNWFVALFSHGEGWHNNHHAKPRCANNGHRWWEFDLTYQNDSLDEIRRIGGADSGESNNPAMERPWNVCLDLNQQCGRAELIEQPSWTAPGSFSGTGIQARSASK